jgi:hypothetical protein
MSAQETLVILIVCYLLYRLGSTLDGLFDLAFEPRAGVERRREQHNQKRVEEGRTPTPSLLARLSASRDEACRSLFKPVNDEVVNLDTARAAHFVGEGGTHGLYKSAKAVAKHTKKWEESIGPWEEYSKAARTIAVLVALLLLIRFSGSATADVVSKSLMAANVLTPVGQFLVGISTLAVFLALYVALRLHHMVSLYSHVGASVVHLQTEKGSAAAIFDVHFPPHGQSAGGTIQLSKSRSVESPTVTVG